MKRKYGAYKFEEVQRAGAAPYPASECLPRAVASGTPGTPYPSAIQIHAFDFRNFVTAIRIHAFGFQNFGLTK